MVEESRELLRIKPVTRLIGGELFRTTQSTLLASDPHAKLITYPSTVDPEFDTWEWQPARFLLRSDAGVYFTQFQYPEDANSDDDVRILSLDDAVNLFDILSDHHLDFGLAFPELSSSDSRTPMDDSRARRLTRVIHLGVTAKFTEADWIALGNHADASVMIANHPRLLRSLAYGDGDYAVCVVEVLSEVIAQAGINEILAIVDDLIDLRSWLREQHPRLYNEVFADELHSALADIEAFGVNYNVPEIA